MDKGPWDAELESILFRAHPLEQLFTQGRHVKSCKHASIACGQFLKKLLTFLDE